MRYWSAIHCHAASETTGLQCVLSLFSVSGRLQRYQKMPKLCPGCTHSLRHHRTQRRLAELPEQFYKHVAQPDCCCRWPRHSSNYRCSVILQSEIRTAIGLWTSQSDFMQIGLHPFAGHLICTNRYFGKVPNHRQFCNFLEVIKEIKISS